MGQGDILTEPIRMPLRVGETPALAYKYMSYGIEYRVIWGEIFIAMVAMPVAQFFK